MRFIYRTLEIRFGVLGFVLGLGLEYLNVLVLIERAIGYIVLFLYIFLYDYKVSDPVSASYYADV